MVGAKELLCGCWVIIAGVALLHNSRPHFDRRMSDMREVRQALESYKLDHGSYPIVEGAVGVRYDDGSDVGSWIPGLAPKYLATVPTDPRGRTEANRQYLYFSDGAEFKIIAHGAEDASWVGKRSPDVVDHKRPWAYGFWTRGAAEW